MCTKAIAPDGTDAGRFTPGESLVAEIAGAGAGDAALAEQGYDASAAAPLVETTAQSVSDPMRCKGVDFS